MKKQKRVNDKAELERYVSGVLDGSVLAPRYVIKAVRRWQEDLENPDLFFDEKLFQKFCRFSRQFKHYKGELAGQHFEPQPWQLFIFANCIALRRKSTGLRKYSLADIYLPRKNGKTFIAAIFSAWFLLLDGEAGPEVYTAALDQEQAKLCYGAATVLMENSIFAPWVKTYRSSLKMECQKNNGVMKPLSKDTKNKDGLNIHAAVCDERHAWPNTEMLDVIKTGMGARKQPFVLSISTAGVDVSNPYFADIEAYKEELDGTTPLEDEHFFMLYCPDEGDDWRDEDVWRKVNPNLGISLDWAYMHRTYNEAITRGGTYALSFKTKNLNLWVDAPEVWLSDEDIVANNAPFDKSRLQGAECYVGVDLSAKTDITAVAFYFPKFNVVDYLFVVPEAKLADQQDRVDYRLWKERGYLTACPGKVIDEDWFITCLLKRLDQYNVKAIAYDPWGMWNLLPKFGRYEHALMEYQQSIRYMSVPTKWLESTILQHGLNFLDNPIIRWMFRNVVLYTDPNANIKLDKHKSRNKIDGVVAVVDAIGAWLNKTSGNSGEIYTQHTLRTISL